MINITNKVDCCGCSACYSVCPQRSISMKEDVEGFLYPETDETSCVKCGLCRKVCPVSNRIEPIVGKQRGYLVRNRDESVRRESTSGGAFTAIAQHVIKNGGVVFGAAYDSDFQVVHSFVEDYGGLQVFRNSKYVQSRMGESFSRVKQFLSENRPVCFSGTPCQVEGLFHYLGGGHENLILVDVVCRAVPSPKIWNRYLDIQRKKYGEDISNIRFRDKYYGYRYSNMAIYREDEVCYHAGLDSDMMLRSFFSDICDRPSCYACRFKKRYRVSDFTLWDCFEPEALVSSWKDSRGTTRVLIHTRKGEMFFEKIREKLYDVEIESDRLVANVREMFFSVNPPPLREQFFLDFNKMTDEEFCRKYFTVSHSFRNNIRRIIRIIGYKMGIYSHLKRIYRWFVR